MSAWLAVGALAFGLLALPGCGGGGSGDSSHAGASGSKHPGVAASAAHDKLVVILTRLTPKAEIGKQIHFKLTASALRADGRFRYSVRFGDGSRLSSKKSAHESCKRSRRSISRQAWSISHRYSKPGPYRVQATISLPCSGRAATTALSALVWR